MSASLGHEEKVLTPRLGVPVVNYSALKTVFVPRFAPTFTDEVCA